MCISAWEPPSWDDGAGRKKGRKAKNITTIVISKVGACVHMCICIVRQRHIGVHGGEDDGYGEQDQIDAAIARRQVETVTTGERILLHVIIDSLKNTSRPTVQSPKLRYDGSGR